MKRFTSNSMPSSSLLGRSLLLTIPARPVLHGGDRVAVLLERKLHSLISTGRVLPPSCLVNSSSSLIISGAAAGNGISPGTGCRDLKHIITQFLGRIKNRYLASFDIKKGVQLEPSGVCQLRHDLNNEN
jgi:hypothetical protein